MPWWAAGYFIAFSLFALAAIFGELKNGNVFRAVVEAVPFVSSLAGGLAYWLLEDPTLPLAAVMGAMLALGVPLLAADTVVGHREAREEEEDYTPTTAALTCLLVFGMFMPAYVWAALYVARAWGSGPAQAG